MHIVFLIPEYFVWHYTKALRLHLNIVSNFIWFTYHFFSISVLLRTFAHPFHSKALFGFDNSEESKINQTPLVNTAMQIGGPVIRLVVLLFGLLICAAVGIAGVILFFAWLVLPAVVVALVFEAIQILIS